MNVNKFIMIFAVVFVFSPSSGLCEISDQKAITQFVVASGDYKDGDYDGAIKGYQKILHESKESGAIYYNIGNAYYKTGRFGKAIVNYHRAKNLIPRDGDLQFNLAYVLSLTNARTGAPSINLINRLIQNHIDFYTLDEMTLIVLILLGALGIVILLSKFLDWSGNIRVFTRVTLVLLIVIYFGGLILKMNTQRHSAIVIASTQANFEPQEQSTKHFELYEGSMVKVIKREGDWIKVKRQDGRLGWVIRDALEAI